MSRSANGKTSERSTPLKLREVLTVCICAQIPPFNCRTNNVEKHLQYKIKHLQYKK
jgi:hypothetical protein